MARIQNVEIDVADKDAQGVIIDKIVTKPNVQSLINSGNIFCLKPISDDAKSDVAENYFDEAHDVMNAGLKLMPLIKISEIKEKTHLEKKAKEHARKAIDLINESGLPYGVTVWIDMPSLMAQLKESKECVEFFKAWSEEFAAKNYGVGPYAGQMQSCCCPVSVTPGGSGGTLLEISQCPDGSSESHFPSLTISQSDNDSCQIYWALMKR